MRPWPMPVTAHVIGVFRAGMTMATWLVVGQNDLWTVVSVAEGTVLATRPTLAAALAIIHAPPLATAAGASAEPTVPHSDEVVTETPD
jgi:hypothetical protein